MVHYATTLVRTYSTRARAEARDRAALAIAQGEHNHIGHEGNPYPLDQARAMVQACNTVEQELQCQG